MTSSEATPSHHWVGRVIRSVVRVPSLRALYVSGVRHVAARRIRRDLSSPRLDLDRALERLERRWSALGSPADDPVFIFGAGWRCGSTWLQRLVMSSGKVLVWGEPFDRSCIVQTLSGQLLPLAQEWPPDEWFPDRKTPVALADQWIANLYPPVPALIEAHRAVFRHLFDAPAREHGTVRWGLKEIRLTTAHARYLRLLFPAAKFVFLVRNPIDAYQSYRGARNPWFERWPDRLTVTARQFGQLWSRLAEDFVDNHTAVGGHLVRYEDLISNPAIMTSLSDYLDLEIVPGVASRPIRGNPAGKEPMLSVECWLLQREVRKLSDRLDYH
jgi:Sulfotransferase family